MVVKYLHKKTRDFAYAVQSRGYGGAITPHKDSA
jgi:hypothetical protein